MKIEQTVKILFAALIVFSSVGCVTTSVPVAPSSNLNNGGVSFDPAAFEDVAPVLDAKQIGNTDYYIYQTRGGSVFLGPILGAISIQSQTKKLAESAKGQYVSISAANAVKSHLQKFGVPVNSTASIKLRPMVVAQRSVEDTFRLSLYVQARDQEGSWVSQYAHHMPSPIPIDQFGKASDEELSRFRVELERAAQSVAGLISLDLAGKLPLEGQPYSVGSTSLFADKFGGLGVYTQPEEIFYENGVFLGKSGENTLIRFSGSPTLHVFGIHSFEPGLFHKFEPKP